VTSGSCLLEIACLVCWSVWKFRNAHVFNSARQHCSVRELVQNIVDEFSTWLRVRSGAGVGVVVGRE
jgi:hypothetical protein